STMADVLRIAPTLMVDLLAVLVLLDSKRIILSPSVSVSQICSISLSFRPSDINECLTSNGGCDALTTCINTNGSRLCSGCPSGYQGSGYTSCTGSLFLPFCYD